MEATQNERTKKLLHLYYWNWKDCGWWWVLEVGSLEEAWGTLLSSHFRWHRRNLHSPEGEISQTGKLDWREQATHSTIFFIIEKLRWNWVSSIIPRSCIFLHEPPLIFTTWVADIYDFEFHSFALHDELSLHLSLFHLKQLRRKKKQ